MKAAAAAAGVAAAVVAAAVGGDCCCCWAPQPAGACWGTPPVAVQRIAPATVHLLLLLLLAPVAVVSAAAAAAAEPTRAAARQLLLAMSVCPGVSGADELGLTSNVWEPWNATYFELKGGVSTLFSSSHLMSGLPQISDATKFWSNSFSKAVFKCR